MLPRNESRNEGMFECSPGTKTGMRIRSSVPPERKPEPRVHSPKPPLYETIFVSPGENLGVFDLRHLNLLKWGCADLGVGAR